jgi:hypothetical protein
MKETYKNIDSLLKAARYSKYGWKICGDIKVLRLLPGMQTDTQCCAVFFVNETAESKKKHCTIKDWSIRENSVLGEKYAINQR